MAQKKARTNTVKHTVVVSRTYTVYSFDKGITTYLDTINTDGKRPTEKELCEKYQVNKVILEEKEVIKKTYELDVNTFMELATEVTASRKERN